VESGLNQFSNTNTESNYTDNRHMSKEKRIVSVGMSEMKTGNYRDILTSIGIGSCIAITLYDSQLRIGALAHAMLSKPLTIKHVSKNLRYIEDAIDGMLIELKALGVQKENLQAKLFGGAHMFKVFDKESGGIGDRNIKSAHAKLSSEGIEIIANDTGGNIGRSISFDIDSGSVDVTTKA
jgi:chemotaxis protein CheD